MSPPARHHTTPPPAIIIACGGEGRRMGGAKPMRELGGIPLVQRMVQWAAPQTDCIALAMREAGQVEPFGLPVLLDSHHDIGPVSALASALEFAAARGRSHALLVGCDQPFLPADLLARLMEAIGNAPAAMPVYAERTQPMATLWRADAARLQTYIAQGGQSLWRFAREIGAAAIAWEAGPGEAPFFNVNDPAALADAEQFLRSRQP